MQVETFEVEEIKDSEASTMAADSEALEIARALGLKGQLALADPKTDTRCPYRRITKLESLVYQTLFPQTSSPENYDSGPIPLRVLQVLAHSKELPMFSRFEIWSPLDAQEPDPVLVAHTKGLYESGNQTFLLARWGECLAPFEKLAAKAKVAWLANRKAKGAELLAEVHSKIANIEHECEIAFSTGRTETHSFYL